MNLLALPAFTDNCIRMLHDGKPVIAVDRGESAPVVEPCDAPRPVLAPILVTLIASIVGLQPFGEVPP